MQSYRELMLVCRVGFVPAFCASTCEIELDCTWIVVTADGKMCDLPGFSTVFPATLIR
eukprot:COSAG02_NODE_5592_length_4206_cov_2.462381_5_plen_58_part_00